MNGLPSAVLGCSETVLALCVQSCSVSVKRTQQSVMIGTLALESSVGNVTASACSTATTIAHRAARAVAAMGMLARRAPRRGACFSMVSHGTSSPRASSSSIGLMPHVSATASSSYRLFVGCSHSATNPRRRSVTVTMSAIMASCDLTRALRLPRRYQTSSCTSHRLRSA